MTDVKIAQETLDGVGDQLLALVTAFNSVDLSQLPEADQTKLLDGVSGVVEAANRFSSVNVPAPNPEPEPTDTPEPGPSEPSEPPVDSSTPVDGGDVSGTPTE